MEIITFLTKASPVESAAERASRCCRSGRGCSGMPVGQKGRVLSHVSQILPLPHGFWGCKVILPSDLFNVACRAIAAELGAAPWLGRQPHTSHSSHFHRSSGEQPCARGRPGSRKTSACCSFDCGNATYFTARNTMATIQARLKKYSNTFHKKPTKR